MRHCPLCDKKNLSGGGYSNRTRATKFNPTGTRRRRVNLQWAKLADGRRLKICARCLKNRRRPLGQVQTKKKEARTKMI